jgi:hypothetical protein
MSSAFESSKDYDIRGGVLYTSAQRLYINPLIEEDVREMDGVRSIVFDAGTRRRGSISLGFPTEVEEIIILGGVPGTSINILVDLSKRDISISVENPTEVIITDSSKDGPGSSPQHAVILGDD